MMNSFLPDCGVLSSPSALKNNLNVNGIADQPVSAAKLGSGSGVSFYCAPKKFLNSPTAHSASSSPVATRAKPRRRAAGSINRGVGHGIKKPNLKAKNKLKKQAKIAVRRLKQVKPPPRLAEHRSPSSCFSSQNKECEEASKSRDGKKFFTSRARAAATVQITKNVQLSANYGNISLKQRVTATGLKKNIGHAVTEKPERVSSLAQINVPLTSNVESNKPKPTRFVVSSPARNSPRSGKENNVIKASLSSSPRSRKSAASEMPVARSLYRASPGKRPRSPEKEEIALRSSPRHQVQSPNKQDQQTPTKVSRNTSLRTVVLNKLTPTKFSPSRSSPRRSSNNSSPITKSSYHGSQEDPLLDLTSPPNSPLGVRNSPFRKTLLDSSEKLGSPLRLSSASPVRVDPSSPRLVLTRDSPLRAKNDVRSSSQESVDGASPVRVDPSSPRLVLTRDSPLRDKNDVRSSSQESVDGASPVRVDPSSPRLVLTRDSPLRAKNVSSSSQESVDGRTPTHKDAIKYFPVFDPERRRSHTKDDQKSLSGRSTGIRGARGDSRQLILDAGQKRFGAEQCKECGLVYEHADPDDEALHHSYHNRVTKALAYTNWKKERRISTIDSHGGRSILVTSDDPHYFWRKVEDVLAVVDEELGFAESKGIAKDRNTKAVLYVTNSKVVGLLIAEPIDEAYKVIPDADGAGKESLVCCSHEPQPVRFGISRLWVKSDIRRSGLASKLVDAFRANMIPHHYLKTDEFAFSDPTLNGLAFARKYMKKDDFLVYRHGV
ncbi:N-acetyltransferase ESCO2 isoform X2 [Hyalella azteca]|uniref:N-acetyltransferase ESCO2 isoform X2 n=1 Tax=Hyalella azteca TaxID=294128 RepID=A0A8B7N7W7_HYAAZ|nr:N-acetyltransferase ESCO2 isoform X2 [Hyalella azteca]